MDFEQQQRAIQAAVDAKDLDACIVLTEQCLRENPEEMTGWRQLAGYYAANSEHEKAIGAYSYVLAREPRQDAMVYMGAAMSLDAIGEWRKAKTLYNIAVQIDPDHALIHLHRSFTSLKWADLQPQWWAEGLADAEWRRCTAAPNLNRPAPSLRPMWDGRPIPGRTLFVAAEQGLGDHIWLWRYLPLLKQKSGAFIVLEAPWPLIRLATACTDADMVVEMQPAGGFGVPCDEWVSIMSLLHVLGADYPSMPEGPYLNLPLTPTPKRIGVCWNGLQLNDTLAKRSIPWNTFGPFCQALADNGYEIVSLQHKEDPFNHDPITGDMFATALRIGSCERVVTIDTSVAHLAGAMGVPTNTILPHDADWRWFHRSDVTCWYASMTLTRQHKPGDWGHALNVVQARIQSPNATVVDTEARHGN